MKVLVADDEAVTRRLLESTLTRWGYEVVVADDGLEALRLLEVPDAPKLAMLDWLMPGMDGLSLCREIRSRKTEPYTYILLLTSRSNQGDVVAGLDAGADDYMVKPFHPQELKVRLRTGKRIIFLQDQLITSREALRDLATHDPLTGLWNRAAILDLLSSELTRADRSGSTVGVILADLDHFKEVNDTYGHMIGDAVLVEAAKAMCSATRAYDAVGRHGGEEFLIVMSGCDAVNSLSHAERLRAAVERASVETACGPVRVTTSMGVAVSHPGAVNTANGLIQAADEALYLAKRHGRNRAVLAGAEESGRCGEGSVDPLQGFSPTSMKN